MRQRGRRSAASLTMVNVDGRPSRLEPPAYLSEAESKLFVAIVGSCAPEQFIESDLPLLVSFIQATLMARDTVYAANKITLWEKAVRAQAMLATKLRLTPHSRIPAKTVGRQPQYSGPQPWEM
jgi:hypothetical protein